MDMVLLLSVAFPHLSFVSFYLSADKTVCGQMFWLKVSGAFSVFDVFEHPFLIFCIQRAQGDQAKPLTEVAGDAMKWHAKHSSDANLLRYLKELQRKQDIV